VGGKRFRLRIDNAAEDVPRLMTAYGRLGKGQGEVALALRPTAARGLLVHVVGDEAVVARLSGRDVPTKPSEAASVDAAIGELKALQHKLPERGPITLRGQWRGWLSCDDGRPVVELQRKIATYGTLHLVSDADGRRWTGRLVREGRWFTGPRDVPLGEDVTYGSLNEAIRGALVVMHDVIGEACSRRDTRRRAAFDEAYADKRPVKPARTRKTNPVDRLKPRKAKRSRKAGSWTHVADPAQVPATEPVKRVSQAVRALLDKGGFTHDLGAGTTLARTTEAYDGFPVGSLVVTVPGEAGLHIAKPPKARRRKAKASAPKAKPRTAKPTPTPPPSSTSPDTDQQLLSLFSAALQDLPDDLLVGNA